MALEDRIAYTGNDVVTESKLRIARLLDMFDHMIVSFSGGKDSMVVAELVREVYDEEGLGSVPVKLVFRDEELIPDDVINTVMRYVNDPRFDVIYHAIPMKNAMFLMGAHRAYTQWDPERAWVRQPPDIAIRQLHPDGLPMRQNELSALTFKDWKGKIALLNGIRAGESIMRLQSCLRQRGKNNWIANEAHAATKFCKPIFDWSEKDVFKYMFDRGIDYAPIYDKQMFCGSFLRVSTPLHEQAFGYLIRLREMYPTFYQQIVSVFPDVDTHVRYWRDMDRWAIISKYPKSFAGIADYCKDHIKDPRNLKKALDVLRTTKKAKETNMRLGRYTDNGACFGFPLLRVFRTMVSGTYMDGIQVWAAPSPADIKYEREAEAEAGVGGDAA